MTQSLLLDEGRRVAATSAVLRSPVRRLRFDLDHRPFLVLMELTRACRLACRHCRAEAVHHPSASQLTTDEVGSVLDDLAALGPPRPIVVLTGGDPLERPDLEDIVAHGDKVGLRMAISPSGTPLATGERFAALRQAGATAVSFSLDGAGEQFHDEFRGEQGSFDWTVAGCRAAVDAGLRLQLNTTVTARTVYQLPGILELAAGLRVSLWSLFFLVPTGRGRELEGLSAGQTEDVLQFLYEASRLIPLKTTEAPQYRRILLERQAAGGRPPSSVGPLYRELTERLPVPVASHRVAAPGGAGEEARRARPPLSVGDGRGVVFVSHLGDVCPSGFLPLVAGNVRSAALTDIYAGSSLLRSLRDPDRLEGRCGRCEAREICGGSRAQAFAATGNPLAEDPTCPHQPPPGARPDGARPARGA
jgi:radical SAM protein